MMISILKKKTLKFSATSYLHKGTQLLPSVKHTTTALIR